MRALQAQLSCAYQAVALVRPAVIGALGSPVSSSAHQRAAAAQTSSSSQAQPAGSATLQHVTTYDVRTTSISGRNDGCQLRSAAPTASVRALPATNAATLLLARHYASEHSAFAAAKWKELAKVHKVNPCNSRLHPGRAFGGREAGPAPHACIWNAASSNMRARRWGLRATGVAVCITHVCTHVCMHPRHACGFASRQDRSCMWLCLLPPCHRTIWLIAACIESP